MAVWTTVVFPSIQPYISSDNHPASIRHHSSPLKVNLRIGVKEAYYIPFLEMRGLRHSAGRSGIQKGREREVRHTASVSFDSFLFVDNITNSRIILKDARKHYESRRSPSQHRLEQQQEVNALSDCLSTLKSTKLFQMDSLRTKLFRSVHARKDIPEDLTQTKRGLRHLIETSIEEMSMRELRLCLADPSRRVEPRIIALQSLAAHQMTSTRIQAVLAAPSQPSESKPLPAGIEELCQFRQEAQLREQAENYLRNNLRRNSTHLIKPKHNKQLYEKLFSACAPKKIPRKSYIRQEHKQESGEGVFKPIRKGAKAAALEAKKQITQHKNKQKQREAIFAVENDLLFDVEMLLTMDRDLAHSKDPQGNSLLHIAAKNRSRELFAFILKRAGPNSLTVKNNLGRTPLDLAKLYGANSIIQLCETYSPYQ